MKRIVVIGGGIGGLTAAYRLQKLQPGADVTVLEAGERWGGVIRSSVEHGCILEHGPDSIVRSKPAGLALVRELGLENEVQPVEPSARRGLIARGNKLLPIPDGFHLLAPGKLWPFLFSPVMSFRGKLRMLGDLALPRGGAGEESLAQFVRRRFGREALERLAQPLLSGIYTADPEQLSLSATMPQFIDMEREHRSVILGLLGRGRKNYDDASGPRYGLFMSLKGGLERLIARLLELLVECSLELNTAVESVASAGAGYRVRCAGGSERRADQLVIALPANATARICNGLDDALCQEIGGIGYSSVATVNFVFARSHLDKLPDAAGFVVPAVEGRHIIACTFSSRKYAGRAPDFAVTLRAFVGGARHDYRLLQDDDTLIANCLKDLTELLGIRGVPTFARVHRWPNSMAQYVVGHADRVRRIRARETYFPGLALIGNGYEGVGIPDVITQAEAAAHRLSALP